MLMNEIKTYTNDTIGVELRTRSRDDDFIVRATDVADALNYQDSYDLLKNVSAGQIEPVLERVQSGKNTVTEREVTYLTEGAFYRLVGQRQAARIKDPVIREKVQKFQSWVFDDVLPSIRKDQAYVAPDISAVNTIRLIEKLDWKSVLDTVASASDYQSRHPRIGTLQDLVHVKLTGMRASDIIFSGREIRTWTGKTGPTQKDRKVAKNYWTNEELDLARGYSMVIIGRLKTEYPRGYTIDDVHRIADEVLGG